MLVRIYTKHRLLNGIIWWAHQDSNLGPKDSGLCSFHYSLDYAFIIFKLNI